MYNLLKLLKITQMFVYEVFKRFNEMNYYRWRTKKWTSVRNKNWRNT